MRIALVVTIGKAVAAATLALAALANASITPAQADLLRVDLYVVQSHEAASEDSPGWNCNTQGNRRCYAGARVQYQA